MNKFTDFAVLIIFATGCFADTFGTGDNQFTIDFVDIVADTSYGGQSVGSGFTTSNIDYNYRIGTYEITNNQWDKFKAEYGTVTGNPLNAYDENPSFTSSNVPTNEVSWYEAAQFVNWLNISNGYQVAYKFIGTQGTSDYALATWSGLEAWKGENLYRHRDAHYFLPTEDEWVKAAYWNGSNIQTYATLDDTIPEAGVDSNYNQEFPYDGPWDIGSGTIELNGTFDMMGNVWEWLESPYDDQNFGISSLRGVLGGGCGSYDYRLASSYRDTDSPYSQDDTRGFRITSVSKPFKCPSADLSGDCFVDILDLAILAQQWCSGLRNN
ncbi:MAG: formylglycine-generating enzyme family protein [Sedimentisphaeraceae bacterium JB056]